jgi:uncharacterized phosphosugar-binding protein
MSVSDTSAGLAYLRVVRDLVDQLGHGAWPRLRQAAELVADALAGGRTIHAFGTGHSHMLAEELSYRAGGLAGVRPIVDERLTVHTDAARSTELERDPSIGDALFDAHGFAEGDVLIVASNSGGNAVPSRLAQRARDGGVRVIAITSLGHATSPEARATASIRLHELADVVVDNGGIPGDAAIEIEGFQRRVGPTSTVVGAAIVNAIVVEAVELLVARGIRPDVFVSSNLAGGDDANASLVSAEHETAAEEDRTG